MTEPETALCAGCMKEREVKVCSACEERTVSCPDCSANHKGPKCTPCMSNVFETGAPAGAYLIGIGESTKGVKLKIRSEQAPGYALLSGDFKIKTSSKTLNAMLAQHAGNHLTHNEFMMLRSNLMKQYNSVDKVLGTFEAAVTEDSLGTVKTFLFHPTQWTVLNQ